MTGEAFFVCGLLLVTVGLFMSDRVRLDLVALLVIVVLAVSGILRVETGIRVGDLVAIFTQKGELVALGEALMRSEEMVSSRRGFLRARPEARTWISPLANRTNSPRMRSGRCLW